MDATFPAVDPNKCLKTYGKMDRASLKSSEEPKPAPLQLPTLPKTSERQQLTSKSAVEFLLEGTLKSKVCRFCLDVTSQLSHLDQILQVAGKGALYKVSVKDIIASFHPFKVADDPNFPDKICENCLDRAVSSYLFTQQCDQAERALKNCFEDIYDKLCKLDSVEPKKKRGRQKLCPNYNTIRIDHEKVINYAQPIINIVNTTSEVLTLQSPINELECLKCSEILPNMESLLNHAAVHPKSMWYCCRLCGTSFAKLNHIKKHINSKHAANKKDTTKKEAKVTYDCKKCDISFEKCSEYLEHMEKHKFKTVMEHLTEKKMDKLCALCFSKGYKMRRLDETICLHGISPELNGDKSFNTILSATLPEIHLDSYTGTKICEKCFNNALTTYVFLNQSHFARNRLGTCVTAMLEKLNTVTDTNKNICVEIASSAIMNINYDETLSENIGDEDDLKIDVLEDEFRLKSEDESEADSTKNVKTESKEDTEKTNKTLLNGYKYANQICGEFLTFKKKAKLKKRFICPVCQKHFISDYFLKRHCSKHLLRNVQCTVCDLQFKSKFHLYEHKKMLHVLRLRAYLSCENCGRCFTEKEKLLRHEERHKNPLCQICSKKFTSQTTYLRHIHKHMKKLAIAMKKHKQFCSFCEKDCSNDNEFSLHVNKVHLQIKAYSCDMCEANFYTEYNLRCHRMIHSEFSKEKCEFCDKVLFSRKKMVIHVRKHIGDTPFCCQMCNESFFSKYKLNKHQTACHGGRFSCKFCTTMFVSKKELKCHINKVHNMF